MKTFILRHSLLRRSTFGHRSRGHNYVTWDGIRQPSLSGGTLTESAPGDSVPGFGVRKITKARAEALLTHRSHYIGTRRRVPAGSPQGIKEMLMLD